MTAAVLAFPTVHDKPAGTLTSVEACALAGASYRQLDYWTRTGVVDAVFPDGKGSGRARYYTASEVSVLMLATRLAGELGTPRVAFDHARRLLETGTTVIAGIRLDLPVEP